MTHTFLADILVVLLSGLIIIWVLNKYINSLERIRELQRELKELEAINKWKDVKIKSLLNEAKNKTNTINKLHEEISDKITMIDNLISTKEKLERKLIHKK